MLLRRHDLRAPALVGAAGVAALATLAVRDPHAAGSYGTCPFLAVTGLPCPGCGGLRAVADLGRGDLVGALGSNALVVLLAAVLGWAWVAWAVRSTGREVGWAPRATSAWPVAAVALVVVFGVVRVLPFGAALAP